MKFTVITLDKDMLITKPFFDIVKRLGWKINFNDKNWLITLPCEDIQIFNFICKYN